MLKRSTVLLALILSCTAAGGGTRALPVQAASHPSMHCASSTPSTSNDSLPEVRGITAHGSLWALLFYSPPAKAGVTEKIVLRITGKGSIHVVGIGPDGQRIAPTWGPEHHSGSNWTRPGAEWGTGWTFPAAGCWHIHAKRSGTWGNVWLDVASGQTA